MKKLAVLLLLLVSAACASTDAPEPLPATIPVPDPRVPELQTQLTELLDRIDVLNHRISQLEERPAAAAPAQVAASTPRTTAPVREAVPPPPPPAAASPRTQRETAAVQEPQRAVAAANLAEEYRQAIMLVGGGRHADARRIFESVFAAEPSGDLADNALFWIGETYFATREYTNAVRYYTRVVNEYSEENKAPDALYKTALAQERTGDLALARRTLQQVIDRYPYSTASATAKAELQRIRY